MQTTRKHKVWSQRHYNAIAHDIRELFPLDPPSGTISLADYVGIKLQNQHQRATLVALAISFAARFMQDSDEAEEGGAFDPIKFLDACSPNTDLYPLSELWENYE